MTMNCLRIENSLVRLYGIILQAEGASKSANIGTIFFCFSFPDYIPGRKIRAGSGRKAPEVTGTWKQYSNRKIFGFFPMISDRFLLESTGN